MYPALIRTSIALCPNGFNVEVGDAAPSPTPAANRCLALAISADPPLPTPPGENQETPLRLRNLASGLADIA